MALILVEKGTATEYSIGTGITPLDVGTVNLDDSGTPTTEESTPLNFEILASTFNYTSLGLTLVNEETGINYELSLDNISYLDTVVPIDMDATGADVRQDIWLKAIVDNDGSVAAGDHAVPDVRLTGIENQ